MGTIINVNAYIYSDTVKAFKQLKHSVDGSRPSNLQRRVNKRFGATVE